MKRLAAAGAKVKSRPIRSIGAMRALSAQFGSMVAIEAYAEHRAIFESADAERMDRRVVKRALGGRVSERDATNLQRGREELIAALTDELKGALLVLPATPMTAPAIGRSNATTNCFASPTCAPSTTRSSATCFGCAASRCRPERTPRACQRASSSLRRAEMTSASCRSGSVWRARFRAEGAASLPLIGHAPDRAAAVVADQQRAVMRHRDADRAAPDAPVVADEADEEILVLAGRLAVFMTRRTTL